MNRIDTIKCKIINEAKRSGVKLNAEQWTWPNPWKFKLWNTLDPWQTWDYVNKHISVQKQMLELLLYRLWELLPETTHSPL